MDKQALLHFLTERSVWYEISQYDSAEEILALPSAQLLYPEADAKNLFLRDNKKRGYYLLTTKMDKHVDLKAFRQQYGTRPLSFASEQDLMELLALRPGTVNPLALLHDSGHRVHWFLDEDLLAPCGLVGLHPNDNTAILWMKTRDLIDIITEHGSPVTIAKL